MKERENQAFEEVLILLEDTEVPETLDWSYFAPFDGFRKLLTEMNIYEYQLMIDREGKESHTLNSAIDVPQVLKSGCGGTGQSESVQGIKNRACRRSCGITED